MFLHELVGLPPLVDTSLGLVSEGKRKIKDGKEFDRYFPPLQGKDILIRRDAQVRHTVDEMQAIIQECHHQTAKLAPLLKGKTLRETCRNIFNFCYHNIQYRLDEEGKEQLREPARIWADRFTGVDCDDYAIFGGCLLTNLGIPFTLRLAEYARKGYYQHVYVIVPKKDGGYFTIDPVKDDFDDEHNTLDMPLTGKEDIHMDLYRLNGVLGDGGMDAYKEVVYKLDDKQRAALKAILEQDENLKKSFALNVQLVGNMGGDNAELKARALAEANEETMVSEEAFQYVKGKNITLEQLTPPPPRFSMKSLLTADWWKRNGGTVAIVGCVAALGIGFALSFTGGEEEEKAKPASKAKKEEDEETVSGFKKKGKGKFSGTLK